LITPTRHLLGPSSSDGERPVTIAMFIALT
jgi:hypothetical protein